MWLECTLSFLARRRDWFGAPSAPVDRLRQPRIELPTHSINLVTLVLIALPGSTWFVATLLITPNHPYLKVAADARRLDARSSC